VFELLLGGILWINRAIVCGERRWKRKWNNAFLDKEVEYSYFDKL